MTRMDIINTLISKYGYQNYLEIGVRLHSDCFNNIIAPYKTAVDPGYETPSETYQYRMESDDFFYNLRAGSTEFPVNHKWDIIFIDGLHTAEQVEKDVLNSLEHLSEGGTIIMHDCNPIREIFAYEIPAIPDWSGTVWKTFYKFRHSRPDLAMWCVDTDWGVGIIQRGEQKLASANNTFYSYIDMDKNRKEYLNLITPEEFGKLFNNDDLI